MVRNQILILFLSSVILTSGHVCKAGEFGFIHNNFMKNSLVVPISRDRNYLGQHQFRVNVLGLNTYLESGNWQEKVDQLFKKEEILKNKTDKDENNNILGMYVLAGTGKLRYNLNGTPLYNFDYEIIKGGGVSLEIPLQSLDERFSVYNELGFSVFKSQTSQHLIDTVGGDPENNYYDINLTFSPNAITLSNIVRYSLTPGEFKYYVAVGIYNSFVVSSTNLKETTHHRNGEILNYTEEAVPDPTVYGLMLLACTGFSYRNIGFELRFDPGHNYSNKLNYSVYMPSFMALLHVRFNPR